ncbi:MAG: UvrD-helicase domain-containing protein [Oscillospiraceae bacterium]|nr:UvrD-helicase domain-containing protein [Oscillospiraceae bacterium]
MNQTEFQNRFIKARKAAIGLDFQRLNEIQREAVFTTQGPLLLLAGAGSGKTTVLINRIANILRYGSGSDSDVVPGDVTEDDLNFLESYVKEASQKDGRPEDGKENLSSEFRIQKLCAVEPVAPWRIIAITFTNKAAGEMKARLEKMLGPGAEDIWASTFHSACVRILRRNIDKLGYDSSFAIYDTTDSTSLMKRILKEMDIEERTFPHRSVLGYISRAKDEMITAEQFYNAAEKSGDVRKKIVGRAYLEYENRMKSSNALDFDDLILFTVRLFLEFPDVLQYYQKRFLYVLVDEYQDTNNLQYLLASSLAGEHKNICVVGDDDQSIYKFRGATIENILNFEKQYKDARVIRLEQNYRSTGLILNAAHDVISNNVGRKGKKLWTESGPGDMPQLHIISDERAEAELIADRIVASAAEGRNWREHAILYRMNAQSNQFETAFKRSGIPYRIFGGTGFYERAEIKDMLAYLCVLHNPMDDVRLLRIINNPPRGIGNTTIVRLTELAAEQEKSIYEVLRESQNHDNLSASAGKLHLFADMIDELREINETAPLDELYETLLDKSGYIRMLEQKKADENISRIENVLELKTNIISFMNENGGNLFDFLSETALFSDLDRDDSDGDRVMMMTMHSAKGLEFDTVFLVGTEEGVFPGIRAIGEPGEMEEERRLCYVAMTRAKRKLYFTAAKRRMLFGKTSSAMPSRFVREIKSDNLEVIEPPIGFGGFDFEFGQQKFGATKQSFPLSGRSYPLDQSTSFSQSHTLSDGYKSASVQKSVSSVASGASQTKADFKKGDTVEHKAFGRGVITGSKPAGGDALLEIDFDGVGIKRMLLNSAARYMTKA